MPRDDIPTTDTEEKTLKGSEAVSAMIRDAELSGKIKPYRKICILGTAPQWQAAPFDDPTWEMWGIFGLALTGKRLTRLYELHDKAIIEGMVKQHDAAGKYWEVARSMGANYITKDAFEQAPEGVRFDFKGKLEKYGPYFASSASWLMAEAIDQDPAEIGIYGINMAAGEEYQHQKPSMSYLIGYAKAKGIKVSIPSSSELLTLTHQYGLEQPPRFHSSMAQRRLELNHQLAHHQNALTQCQIAIAHVQGAIQQLEYFEQNWKS